MQVRIWHWRRGSIIAFTTSAIWECETGANDANAGGFDPGVAGFPTDGTTDANTGNTASPVFSSASYNFAAGDVGAWIYIKSGTSSLPGWYKIASVASNKATLSAAIGAAVLAAGTPSTAAGIATVGTPTTLTWGIDYSQQASPQITFTDMVIGGTTTTFTSAAHPVGKNFVGNVINVTSGTNFTVQRVAVVSTAGTTATCDKSLGTAAASGGNGKLGGALISPALAASVATITGNTIWIQTGAYTVSSASTNVANGCVLIGAINDRIEGYGTVRGDLGTAPVLTASGISGATVMAMSNGGACLIRNITVDCASLGTMVGFAISSTTLGYLLTAKNATNGGFINATAGGTLLKCLATGCATVAAFNLTGVKIACIANNNTITGFSFTSGECIACIASNNSGASSDGFTWSTGANGCDRCVSYNNGRHGYNDSSNGGAVTDSIAENNAGTGLTITGASSLVANNASYNNGTNYTLTGTFVSPAALNNLTPTAEVFVNAASGNFALNANAGGGALLRAAGMPGLMPDGLSTGYLDIGAIQSPPLWPPARAFTGSN